MFDFHIHTNFSDDCNVEMESYIQPAIEKRLSGICFTDHLDIDYPNSSNKFLLEYASYFKELNRLKDRYRSKLEIFFGVEFGMQPHILESDTSFFAGKSFDYVLGSIHCTNKKELYNGDYLEGITEHQGITNYFTEMLYCVKNFKSYNNLGHLDAISRYVNQETKPYKAEKYIDYIEEILKAVIEAGKGIELNTSGKRYVLGDFHPEKKILKLYKELGGEIVTLGSDSHSTNTLAYSFDEAVDVLISCGFRYYAIYRNGKPEFIKL
jgi:histidinol-phosphatase (PHP family)